MKIFIRECKIEDYLDIALLNKKNGIGKMLLNEVEKWARETGACGIRLVSGAARTGAHGFYSVTLRQLSQTKFIKKLLHKGCPVVGRGVLQKGALGKLGF